MRRTVFVLVATLLATLIAGPAGAEAGRERVEFGPTPLALTVLNACNGELVSVTGEYRGFFQEVQTPSGQTNFKQHFVLQGTGVGSEGNKYVIREISHSDFLDGPPPFTSTVSLKFVSEGSDANFVGNTVYHGSPNGEIFFEEAGSACRG
jgi:hypothetical protein